MDEQSIFLAALEKDTPESQALWLAEICGTDHALKARIEALLQSHREASSFLERPALELEATVAFDATGKNLAASLEAGLSPAFGGEAAIVIGNASHSVLQALGQSMQVPRVVLRDAAAARDDRIVRPKSPEMPERNSDSRYRLDGEIARGGMGAILKGRDTDLGRDLAIKVLLDAHKDKPEVVQRFIEEAQIGGQLQHPGIAPVYELGQFADRRPFFSMKLVKGETLSKLLADRAEPAIERGKYLGIFEQICQTMAYAHSRGVIHRDLKPANIMVGAFGEVQVMDWGLAKVLPAGGVADEKKSIQKQQGQSIIQTLRSGPGSDAPGSAGSIGSQTQLGSVMGTPAYMPPEQALGEIDHLDERADVFGLGAILCEILTGRPPYVADDAQQVFRLASRGKLQDCFRRLDACAGDAELIVLAKHCLELEPKDRPRDAGALAERMTRYLQSVDTKLRETEMAHAAQAARLEQQQRSTRNLRKMLAGLAVVALVAALACVAALVANKRANELAEVAQLRGAAARASAEVAGRERTTAVAAKDATKKALTDLEAEKKKLDDSLAKAEQAEQAATAEKNRADHVAEVARQHLYYAQMHLAQQVWREPRGLPNLQRLLTNWVPKGESIDRRGWEWFYLNSLPHQNLRTLTESKSGGSGYEPCIVAWHAATKRLAAGDADGAIRIWDVDREQTLLTLRGPAPVHQWCGTTWFAWSPNGEKMAAGCNDGTIHVWDTGSGRELGVFQGNNSPVLSVAYSSDGTRVATWGMNGKIKIWDVETRRVTGEVSHPGGVFSGAWSPDDKLLASGHNDGTVTISGIHPGDKIVTLRGHASTIHRLAWSPDGSRIVSGSEDFTSKIWDVASERIVLGPLRHSHSVTAVAWEPDGKRLATGSADQSVKIWNATTGHEDHTLRGHSGYNVSVSGLAWSPDGRLVSGGTDYSVRVWNSVRDQESSVLPGLGVRTTSVSWSPDGKRLASGGDDGKIRIWNPATRKEVLSIKGHDERRTIGQFGLIRSLAWSPDSSQLVSAGVDGTAKVWEAATGREIFALPTDRGSVWSVTWSPDGSRLAAGSQDGSIRVVELREDPPKVHVFAAHTPRGFGTAGLHGVRTVAWSPMGDRLASGGLDDLVKIWDPIRGAELASLPGDRTYWITGVAWSPDGKRLGSTGLDGLVITWDAQTGQKLTTMRGHNTWVEAVAWNPDGARLASAGLDNSVRISDPLTGEETLALRGDAGFFHDLSWRPDGAQLAAASSDGQIWIWDATPGFERDTTPRALPYIDRKVASGTARREDVHWFAQSYMRAERYTDAREFLDQQRQADPENGPLAAALAVALLMERNENNRDQWTAIKPTEMKSEKGATLTVKADGSILVSGTNIEVMKITDPWVKLAAAYHIRADQQALGRLLERHPAAAVGIGDLYAADNDWKRAIAEYSKLISAEAAETALLTKRASACMATENWDLATADWRRVVVQQPDQIKAAFDAFQKAERWNVAAEFGLQLVQQKPDGSSTWIQIAPVLILADDQAAYSDYCLRMIQQFANSQRPEDLMRLVRVCLMGPDSIDIAQVPGDRLARLQDEGPVPDWFPSWGWSSRALWAYRSGDAETAVKFVAKSEGHEPAESAHAINLAVLAMAEHQLRHPDEARRALDDAQQVIQRLQADASKRDHNLLIAQIQFREAEMQINGKAKP